MKLHSRFAASFALVALFAPGCAHHAVPGISTAAVSQPGPCPHEVHLTASELTRIKPNELGRIPILEYHDIGKTEKNMVRSAANFRNDLKLLYKENFRPISLSEYLNNRINLPPGASPVIITFDDTRRSQFKMLSNGSIDPDCAVGIMKAFHDAHPDWALRGCFFVLPNEAFGQSKLRQAKLRQLVTMGFELGNHTVTHTRLSTLSDSRVQQELASCVYLVRKMAPNASMDTIALPEGVAPRNRALLAKGSFEGTKYANRAVLLVGANPAPSPVSIHFNPMRLPRIIAYPGPSGSDFWLKELMSKRKMRYVSDGDPNTVTVPKALAASIDHNRLQGAVLRVY